MPELRIIGDTIFLDGEPVADIRPEVRATLRDELREAVERANKRLWKYYEDDSEA